MTSPLLIDSAAYLPDGSAVARVGQHVVLDLQLAQPDDDSGPFTAADLTGRFFVQRILSRQGDLLKEIEPTRPDIRTVRFAFTVEDSLLPSGAVAVDLTHLVTELLAGGEEDEVMARTFSVRKLRPGGAVAKLSVGPADRVVVRYVGAPGLSAAEQARDAGFIEQPTPDALAEWMRRPAEDVAAEVRAAGTGQLSQIEAAGDETVGRVNDAGAGQLEALATARAGAIVDVNDAVAAHYYPDTATGLAATVEGGYFKTYVLGRAVVWRKVDGAADFQGEEAMAADVANLRADVDSRVTHVPAVSTVLGGLTDGDGPDPHVGLWLDRWFGVCMTDLDGDIASNFADIRKRLLYDRVVRDYPAYIGAPNLFSAQRNMIAAYGQSGSAFANGGPALTTTPRYPGRVKMFNGGVKANPDNAATTMTHVVDAYDDDVAGDAGTNRGQGYLVEAANLLLDRIFKRSGRPASALPELFVHTSGVGGQSIGSLLVAYYNRFVTSVQAAKDLATAEGKTFAVPVIIWDQGEANQGVTSSPAYQAAFLTLKAQMIATVRSICPDQTFDPIFIILQKSWSTQPTATTSSGSANAYPASVTLAARELQTTGVYVAGPDYAAFYRSNGEYRGSDGIHKNNLGYLASAGPIARIMDLVDQGLDPKPLDLISSWIEDGWLKMRFDVPVQPLGWGGADLFGEAVQYGFRLIDDAGALPLEDLDVQYGDEVWARLSRPLDGAPRLRIGLDEWTEWSGLSPESGVANLCDADNDNGLPNYVVACEVTPLVRDAA